MAGTRGSALVTPNRNQSIHLSNPHRSFIYLQKLHDYDHYLVQCDVDCLILPGRIGATDEGWFDAAEVMGFTNTPLFQMRQLAVFEIDHDLWLQGYLPTSNYQATVVIYELVPTGSSGG